MSIEWTEHQPRQNQQIGLEGSDDLLAVVEGLGKDQGEAALVVVERLEEAAVDTLIVDRILGSYDWEGIEVVDEVVVEWTIGQEKRLGSQQNVWLETLINRNSLVEDTAKQGWTAQPKGTEK